MLWKVARGIEQRKIDCKKIIIINHNSRLDSLKWTVCEGNIYATFKQLVKINCLKYKNYLTKWFSGIRRKRYFESSNKAVTVERANGIKIRLKKYLDLKLRLNLKRDKNTKQTILYIWINANYYVENRRRFRSRKEDTLDIQKC